MKDYLRSFGGMLGLIAVILVSIAVVVGPTVALALLLPLPWGLVAGLAWFCVVGAALLAAAERSL